MCLRDSSAAERARPGQGAGDGAGGGGAGGDAGGDGLELSLYMTYQPCHHSGGRVPKGMTGNLGYAAAAPQHPTTCSEHLKAFYLAELKPRGVALELVLVGLGGSVEESLLLGGAALAEKLQSKF